MKTYHTFDDTSWQRIERDWRAWWNHELDRPLVTLEVLPQALIDQPFDRHLSQFALDMPVAQVLDHYQSHLESTQYYGDAYPKWWVNYGPGVAAAFLGATVEHGIETTWFHPPATTSIDDVRLEYNADNPYWLRVQEITRAALDRWGAHVAIGITDIGGNMDILASMRGTQDLLTDTLDAPDTVAQHIQTITQLWLRYFNELYEIVKPAGRGITNWGPCWNPDSGYMLQSDFSYMISPRMFERFVLPDLVACCEALDYAFYHMDGIGQIPHLDMLLSIERLRGIQWQPGDGQPLADGWLDLLKRIRDGGKLCQVYVTREGALTIKRELGGKGFLFHIINEPYIPPDEAQAFLDQIYA